MSMGGGTLFRIGGSALPFLLPLKLQIVFGPVGQRQWPRHLRHRARRLRDEAAGPPGAEALRLPRGAGGERRAGGAGHRVCAAFTPAWPLAAIFIVLAVGGVTRSLQFTALNTLSFADVPSEKLAPATAMSGTLQQLGQALGVVLGSLTLAGCDPHDRTRGAGGHRSSPSASWSPGVVVLGCVPSALRLPRDAGARVSGHRG
jgi:hypothetical protein